jgi:hypothetical protein
MRLGWGQNSFKVCFARDHVILLKMFDYEIVRTDMDESTYAVKKAVLELERQLSYEKCKAQFKKYSDEVNMHRMKEAKRLRKIGFERHIPYEPLNPSLYPHLFEDEDKFTLGYWKRKYVEYTPKFSLSTIKKKPEKIIILQNIIIRPATASTTTPQ